MEKATNMPAFLPNREIFILAEGRRFFFTSMKARVHIYTERHTDGALHKDRKLHVDILQLW